METIHVPSLLLKGKMVYLNRYSCSLCKVWNTGSPGCVTRLFFMSSIILLIEETFWKSYNAFIIDNLTEKGVLGRCKELG